MNLKQWFRLRLDNSFKRRPVHRIKFYVFGVLNTDGELFRLFTTREKADRFIHNNSKFCRPESVLVEVE